MKKNEEIEALEYAIEVLQKKIDKLKGDNPQPMGGPDPEPLPPDPTHPKP